jgi:hypothetical protein
VGYANILKKHVIGTDDAPTRFYRTKVGAMSTEVLEPRKPRD